jgi:hypothetical protein
VALAGVSVLICALIAWAGTQSGWWGLSIRGGPVPAHAVDDGALGPPGPAGEPVPGDDVAAPASLTPAFASIGGLLLYLPATHPVLIAYHEASKDASLALSPLGTCTRNANRYEFEAPPASPGPRYIVMSTRGRPHPATSAVDIAMHAETVVRSPVTGTVARVKPYRLYGRYVDLRLVLDPTGERGLRVVVIHLTSLRVRPGSPVVAGVTPIGSARPFPFRSQVNDYVGGGIPHVHVEVKRVGP